MRSLIIIFLLFASTILFSQNPGFALSVNTHHSHSKIVETDKDDPYGDLNERTVEVNFSFYRSEKWLLKAGMGFGNRSADMQVRRERSGGSSLFGLFQLGVGIASRDAGVVLESLSNIPNTGSSRSSRFTYSGKIYELTAGAERVVYGSWGKKYFCSVSATLRRTQLSNIDLESSGPWNSIDVKNELEDAVHRLDAGFHFYARPVQNTPILLNTSFYLFSFGNSGVSMYENKLRIGLSLGITCQF